MDKEYFEVDISTLQSLASWAAECAEKALPVYESIAGDDRPGNAIIAAKEFSKTGKRTNRLRKIAMDAHKASRDVNNSAASAAARSASLAAASAYTHPFRDIRQALHILGPAAYSALAIELQDASNQKIGDMEIEWAVNTINDDTVKLLANYPEQEKGKNRIEQLLFLLDNSIRNKELK